jgi:Fur family transcriptional regulator, ferric uptake regulator
MKKWKFQMSEHDHGADELLKVAKLKVTEQRRVILNFLLNNHGPFTVEELSQHLKDQSFDLATLYRSMSTFEESGLVEKRLFGDGVVRWELAAHNDCHEDHHQHHHHLMCSQCKKIVTLDICVPDEMQKLVEGHGFKDLKHHLEFSGICPECQKIKG